MKNKKINIRVIISILLLLTSLSLLGYYLYDEYKYSHISPEVKKLIKEKKQNNFSDKDIQKPDVTNYINELPTYRSEYGNEYIMGKLEIPNINIDTLVVRAKNNEYYLKHNIYNQYDELGIPFFDHRNENLSADKQINIYGHNTRVEKNRGKLPFVNLEAYLDKAIFDNYKDVYLSIDERKIHYEVIAVKIINKSDNEHMKLIFYNNDDFISHIDKMLSNTTYKQENLTYNYEDNFLVLQVCNYNPSNTYILIICKEKNE